MHLDDFKTLYGKPFSVGGPFKNSPHVFYSFHEKEMYPKNIYNPGTEKMESRCSFYLHPNTLCCVAVNAGLTKVLITPYGKSVNWTLLNGPKN